MDRCGTLACLVGEAGGASRSLSQKNEGERLLVAFGLRMESCEAAVVAHDGEFFLPGQTARLLPAAAWPVGFGK